MVDTVPGYDPILCNVYETVASEYHRDDSIPKSTAYQSEAALEKMFIDMLASQGYQYLDIHDETGLLTNLRRQLERLNASALNHQGFTDTEWSRLFHSEICKPGDGIIEKSRRLQDGGAGFSGGIVSLILDSGRSVNIRLIDKQDIHNNQLQVINQYVPSGGVHPNRYDVTILCNGLPVVHVELKRRGVALKTAYLQIDRYQRESFWASSGLYEYVQVFVISNGTHTKYYANTVRDRAVHTHEGFEFTSWWADAENHRISDLVDFTQTFFSRVTLLNIITKYCVLGVDNVMRVMRPYQIAACESVTGKVRWSIDNHVEGCIDAGGYVWHTTGSGKTLTSFKCARLLSKWPDVDKVLFVVDRKDLDAQTVREYDRFEKGAADSSSSTRQLEAKLADSSAKIIVTTIQKLGRLVNQSRALPVYQQRVVFIFDECHRSQFGDMHEAIIHKFKRYHIFGFTGTPIFAVNTGALRSRLTKVTNGKRELVQHRPVLKTTEQVFGTRLHSYTIVDAIHDENVLPFRVDYLNTVSKADNISEEQVEAIDDKSALMDAERISDICHYIVDKYATKTNNGRYSSMLCCDDIPAARAYYQTMKQMKDAGQLRYKKGSGVYQDLRVAVIFSYAVNGEVYDGAMDDEKMDTDKMPQSDREFLESAIQDYNQMFPGEKLGFDAGQNFTGYYMDVGRRLKEGQLDILIVVNMMLTGFDAQRLGCLWVDKHLRAHGLIQAFSRTNRIYDRQKTYGNIVCFRSLQQEVDDAIAMFGNKDACGIVTLKTYDEYYNGYTDEESGEFVKGYKALVEDLHRDFPLDKLSAGLGESDEKEFVGLFGTVLQLQNVLRSFDEFEGHDLFNQQEFQDYTSSYLDSYDRFTRHEASGKVNVNADLVFDIQLVDQIDINVDYILMLVEKYAATMCKDASILVEINKTVSSSPQLRSKRALIDAFLETINADSRADWHTFVKNKALEDLQSIIQDESLKAAETFQFMRNSMDSDVLKDYGMDFDSILPPMSRRGGLREAKKRHVYDRLSEWLTRYQGVIDHEILRQD